MSTYHQQRVGFGPRSPSGLGNLRVLSINTWLILINIAVFVLNNVVLQNRVWPVSAGAYYAPVVTADQIARGQVDRQHAQFYESDGTFHCPIFDPQSMMQDRLGRQFPTQIGYERFRPQPVLEAFGHFSTAKFWREGQLWRLVTFQFLHADLSHIVLNMLGLFFFGGMVEQYLGRRRYAVFYLLSGVCGALCYMLLNLIAYTLLQGNISAHIPFLLRDDPYTPLIGASAGVFGVLMAAAFIAPTAIVSVLFVIPMKLRTAVYIFLGLAIFNLYQHGQNAGGDAAHVGGALAGAYLIRRPYVLRDFVTLFGLLGDREAKPVREPRPSTNLSAEDVAFLDRIIAKVQAEGLDSLNASERAFLRRIAAGGQ